VVFTFLAQCGHAPAVSATPQDHAAEDPAVGRTYASRIQAWQPRRSSAPRLPGWRHDSGRCAARARLDEQIAALEATMADVAKESVMATTLASLPGFGAICTTELAGEIGTVTRFPQEGSLALYLGMATLDHSSGTRQSSKPPRQVNTRATATMMIAVDRHRKQVLNRNATTRKNASKASRITKRFARWVGICVASSTRCSSPSGPMRCVNETRQPLSI